MPITSTIVSWFGWFVVFQQYFSYIVAVRFIGGVSVGFTSMLRCAYAQGHVGQGTHLPAKKNKLRWIFCLCGAILNLKASCFGAILDIVIELIVYGSVSQINAGRPIGSASFRAQARVLICPNSGVIEPLFPLPGKMAI